MAYVNCYSVIFQENLSRLNHKVFHYNNISLRSHYYRKKILKANQKKCRQFSAFFFFLFQVATTLFGIEEQSNTKMKLKYYYKPFFQKQIFSVIIGLCCCNNLYQQLTLLM